MWSPATIHIQKKEFTTRKRHGYSFQESLKWLQFLCLSIQQQ